MTVPPPPGPPPGPPAPPPGPPPPPPGTPRRRSIARRILGAIATGLLTGIAALAVLVFLVTGGLGPVPEAADVCAEVDRPELAGPAAPGIPLSAVCGDIDTNLDLPLGGADGFEAVAMAPDPPGDPSTSHPDYLVWDTDGCSAPVLGAGPFDFSLACTRHDFGWRNLKAYDQPGIVPIWHVGNKDRVDAGFLFDMRVRCAALPRLEQIGCDLTARVYYTAVRLNPSGVAGIPDDDGP